MTKTPALRGGASQSVFQLGSQPACLCLTHAFPLACLSQVGTLETGEIDYEELKQHLIANNHRPAILNVNIGTTVKGAVDDLDKARVRDRYPAWRLQSV